MLTQSMPVSVLLLGLLCNTLTMNTKINISSDLAICCHAAQMPMSFATYDRCIMGGFPPRFY